MKAFAIAVFVLASVLAHGQTSTEKKPSMSDWTGAVSSNTIVSSIHMYRTVIYSQPKDGKILMEFRDDKDKLVFTVFVDGTVKAESGADLNTTTKEFWKNMADAFAAWKESACPAKTQ